MGMRKERIISILFCWAWLVAVGHAQIEEAWRKRLNGAGNGVDDAKGLVVDGSGNVYVAGAVVNANGVTIAAITKYNANGDFVWSVGDSAGTPERLAREASGNLYLAGTTGGTGTQRDFFIAKFDPAGAMQWYYRHNASPNGEETVTDFALDASGNTYVTGGSSGNYLTVKCNASGQLQWQAHYNGPANGYDNPTGIALDNGGNVYVTGRSVQTGFFSDYLTVKYNSAGVEQWSKSFDGAIAREDRAAEVATDNAGNIYVTGWAYHPHSSITTVKYNTEGVQQWATTSASNYYVQGAKAVKLDNAGNVYALGYFQNSSEMYRYLIIKYDNAGVQQWDAVHISGDANPTDMVIDGSGNVYVTGYSGQPLSFPIDVKQIKYDYNTVKFNSAGVREWFVTLTEDADSRDFARAMTIDDAGNVYVTGRSIDDIVTVKYRLPIQTTPTELVADRVYLRTAANGGEEVSVPVAGQQYYLHANWRNTGSEAASNFRVELQLNGSEVCSFNSTNAPGNSSQTTVCSTPITWPAGSAVITATLDGFDQISEAIENNNFSSRIYGYAAFGDFELTTHVRSTDDFNQNGGADICLVYGYQDEFHYYYVMFNRAANESRVYKVSGADRIDLGSLGSFTLPDNAYHEVRLVRSGATLQVFFDGVSLGTANDSEYGSGGLGLGSYNDAPLFDDLCIRALQGTACLAYENFENGAAANWRAVTASRWHVVADNGDNAYGLNTTSYSNLDPLRLGEISLFAPNGAQPPCPGPAIYPVAAGATSLPNAIRGRSGSSIQVDIRLKENPQPIDAFGFTLQVDPTQLAFEGASAGDLTSGFLTLNAQENPVGSGNIICGGFGSAAIPTNSAGVLLRLTFRVKCETGDSSALVLRDPVDDATRLSLCPNVFHCLPCVRDGDVNVDGTLTPGDALCAFQIYLNNGVTPAACDAANTDCEATTSDVNCDGRATPGDALAIFSRYLQGLPPLSCFAQAPLSKAQLAPRLSLHTRTAVASGNEPELVYVTLTAAQVQGLSAFGLALDYPLDKLQFLGVRRSTLTAQWHALDGIENAPGQITLGGFHHEATRAAEGEVCELIFAAKGEPLALHELHVQNLSDDFKNAFVHAPNAVAAVPAAFNLYQNSPNPFHAAGKGDMLIRFDLPGAEATVVELSIYNIAGQLVRQLLKAERTPGAYELRWDGRDAQQQLVPSGIYLYRLKAGKQVLSKSMTVVR